MARAAMNFPPERMCCPVTSPFPGAALRLCGGVGRGGGAAAGVAMDTTQVTPGA